MLRRTVTILSLLGLLLSVAAWPLSYLMPTFRTYHYQFFAQNGALSVTRIAEPDRPVGLRMTDKNGRLIGSDVKVEIGFRLLGHNPSVTTSWLPTCLFNRHYRFVLIPLWMLLVPCASAFWFLWWPPHRSRRRRKLGLCVICGYDLRASKERCPECGSEFESSAV